MEDKNKLPWKPVSELPDKPKKVLFIVLALDENERFLNRSEEVGYFVQHEEGRKFVSEYTYEEVDGDFIFKGRVTHKSYSEIEIRIVTHYLIITPPPQEKE